MPRFLLLYYIALLALVPPGLRSSMHRSQAQRRGSVRVIRSIVPQGKRIIADAVTITTVKGAPQTSPPVIIARIVAEPAVK